MSTCVDINIYNYVINWQIYIVFQTSLSAQSHINFITMLQDPQDWDDVLTKRKLQGTCNKDGCNGQDAVSLDYYDVQTPTLFWDGLADMPQ